MEHTSHTTRKLNESAVLRQSGYSNGWWRILFFAVVFSLVTLLAAHRLPVWSDDGGGVGDSDSQSSELIWKYPLGENTPIPTGKSTAGDLLTNGNMDQMGFYWRPPNHWIAGAWFEWFSTIPYNFPEFNDGFERGFYHTYPSSQRLLLWGNDYAAGLMQSVSVTPCVFYQFQAYGQSRPGSHPPPPVWVNSHMKAGIEPYGWMSGRSITDYDPGLEPEEFPNTVVWSPEATHNFYFAPYQVTAEAQSDNLTVILYSYPEVNLEAGVYWNDTIWDTASLVKVPPPSGMLPVGDDLLEPDGLITNLHVSTLPGTVVVEWDTLAPSSTQVRYRIVQQTTPVTTTETLTHSIYLPQVAATIGLSALNRYSPADTTPVLHHRAVLTGLPANYTIDFVALSRRLKDEACITSASRITRATSPNKGYSIFLPALMAGQ